VNAALARSFGAAIGSERPPNLFMTLARHRRLFRRWLVFAGALMPNGRLPRPESELLILRVAYNCGSDYEWIQHERIALTAGLSHKEVERVREGPEAVGWSDRERLLLRAADELHANRQIGESTWLALRPQLDDAELIELCMLVGHYEMLAMTLGSLRVEPDSLSGPAPLLARALAAVARRRRRHHH